MLWFHEYDDLDVKVEKLRNAKWGIKKELVDEEVKVKIEDLDMNG